MQSLARVLTAVAVAAFVVSAPLAASAEPDPRAAAESFKAGSAAYARKDFRGAAQSFEDAYHKAPAAAAMYNAGIAWESADEKTRAADDYTTAIGAGLTGTQLSDAQTRLAALEKSVGRLDVSGPANATVSVEHVVDGPVPAKVHLAPGVHQVKGTFAGGGTSVQNVTIGPSGGVVSLAIEPPHAEVVAAPPPPAPAETTEPAKPKRLMGWIALGGAGVLAGTAVILGSSALSARDDFNASNHTDQSAHDRAASLRTWTNVMWVGAGVVGAVGVYLLIRPAGGSDAKTTAWVGVGPGQANLRLTF